MKYSRKGSTRSLKALWGDATPYSRSLSQISPIKASIRADRLVSAMRRSTLSLSWSFGLMEVAPDGWVPAVETGPRARRRCPPDTHIISNLGKQIRPALLDKGSLTADDPAP